MEIEAVNEIIQGEWEKCEEMSAKGGTPGTAHLCDCLRTEKQEKEN